MRLDYKIIWIENEEDFLNSFPFERVETHIRSEGFVPILEKRISLQEMKKPITNRDCDLLIVDFNLTDDGLTNGSNLIEAIRENNCLTEVIFYSSASRQVLVHAAAEHALEGVYFSGRDDDSLVRRITDIFDLTVHKVLDINNMRGLVMAGVAELDILFDQIIVSKHERLDANARLAFRKKIVGKLIPDDSKRFTNLVRGAKEEDIQALGALFKKLKELDPIEIGELLTPGRMDSAKRANTVIGLCSQHTYIKQHKSGLSDINNMFEWRNALAHQKAISGDDGAVSFKLKRGEDPQVFDGDRARNLRTSIQQYVEKLTSLLAAVNNQSSP
jgi:hypothetical protein